ncbi:MAG TPA: hypothetical protein VNT79_03700 [Phycisphaerae bacterium]|nr:hypothetical protein [Phycisphaerae bacterium]
MPRSTMMLGCIALCLLSKGALAQSATSQPADSTHNNNTSAPAPLTAGIAYEDLAFLVSESRRAFRAKVLGAAEKAVTYRPVSLRNLRGVIHLTLRVRGAILVEAESPDMTAVEAANAAGAALASAAVEKELKLKSGGDALGLEFEWLGAREIVPPPYYEKGGVWSDGLLHSFEPAVEGIGVCFREKIGLVRPSLVITRGYTPDLMLAGAESAIELRGIHKLRFEKDIGYFRFGSHLLWQPDAKTMPISLARGDTVVSDGAVTAEGLDAAIARIGAYLLFRQNTNGEFAQTYLPAFGTYGRGNAARSQLRALEGVAVLAKFQKDDATFDRLKRGIEAFKTHLEPLVVAEKRDDGALVPKEVGLVLAPAGHRGHLEITSRLLTAMRLSREPKSYEAQITRVLDGLLASQTDSGFIAMSVEETPQATERKPNVADCCRALVALATAAAEIGDKRTWAAVEKGVHYFQSGKLEALDPVAAAALIRVLSLLYPRTNDARVSDFAFELADRFVAHQTVQRDNPYPELAGAIHAHRPGEVGSDSAVYLSAICDALGLAERIGDRDRISRYRASVEAAARFVMQLEVREAGCFFMRDPASALGGIRAAPWDGRLRVDDTAAGLVALIDTRRALFGPLAP